MKIDSDAISNKFAAIKFKKITLEPCQSYLSEINSHQEFFCHVMFILKQLEKLNIHLICATENSAKSLMF